ncbi:MAG: ammonium transporter [Betaproteobacteria bacterium]|nr:ammonium transporter [Betaproteobacteria bacterium]
MPATAAADEFSGADTAFIMICAALVMLMTPAGLALFYGGLTQRKSVLNTVGMSYVAFCAAILAWMVIGYSIAFGGSENPLSGGLEHVMLASIGVDDLSGTIPTTIFVLFQGCFAAIAVAIVSGSIIERLRFSTWLLFVVLWVTLCYAPIAHWIWGGGLFDSHNELDFAGGTVVHISSGVSGLVLALLLGRRRVEPDKAYQPYSIKFTLLGSALLWFGWFGFNAGSALAADKIAANAMLVTAIAAAAGGLAWLFCDWVNSRQSHLFGAASGVVSGLVGITPAAGFVGADGALIIGVLSGLSGFFAVTWMKKKFGYDDALDAFGIHGAVGIVGSLLTGMLANPAISGEAGLFYGEPGRMVAQSLAVVTTVAYSAAMTAAIYFALKMVMGSGRISDDHESEGLDSIYHGEQEGPSARTND